MQQTDVVISKSHVHPPSRLDLHELGEVPSTVESLDDSYDGTICCLYKQLYENTGRCQVHHSYHQVGLLVASGDSADHC